MEKFMFNNLKNLLAPTSATLLLSLMSTQSACVAQTVPASGTANVTIDAAKGKPISSDILGIFFEDLNYAADGGLYAELVQNRSFEYSEKIRPEWNALTSWELIQRGGKGKINAESAISLHANNPQYAVLNVEQSGVGLSNSGFDGIPLKAGENYKFSFFARRMDDGAMPMTVQLESKSGTVYGRANFANIGKDWTQYSATLPASATDKDARLVLIANGTGRVAVDMVSLFPEKTFRNRPNGLRADLAQTVADLKPKFVRFPGGCLAHGDGINNIYNWKNTIGPIERRKAQRNIWGYHQTTGLGYFEYFQFCEDIGAKPLPVVAAGVSCQNSFQQWGVGQQCIPLANMDEYIQDVLDLVEYANGPVTSYWGAKRAAAGHAAPFGLKYLGVGNEDHITPEFRQRFKMINDAIKAKYPAITVIGTTGPSHSGSDYDEGWKFANEQKLAMVDEHYYEKPEWFLNNVDFYDKYDRSKSKVYLGEYASQGNTLFNALSEAAYMTGLERNGDVVQFASYAPLLAKQNHTQWNPNLIYFDNSSVLPTVNYYVQKLFSLNAGDSYLSTNVSYQPLAKTAAPVGVFVGTWNTQAQFDDVKVSSGTREIAQEKFDAASSNWKTQNGTWTVENGVYTQSANAEPALSKIASAQIVPTNGQLSYTYSLRARKTGGQEGFLIGFGATNDDNYFWWNIGGWKNTQHGIEKRSGGTTNLIGNAVKGEIELNRWYDIKIEVDGARIRCYLDGKLIHDVQDQSVADKLLVSSVRDQKSGDIILKVVNPSAVPVQSNFRLNGMKTAPISATKTVLSGDPSARNSFENPNSIVPRQENVVLGNSFVYAAAPHSFTVLRLKTR